MTDLEDRLRTLSASSSSAPAPLEQLTSRAGQLRRRRRVTEGVSAVAVVALVAVLGSNLPLRTTENRPPAVVFDPPPFEPPSSSVPGGWERTTIGVLTVNHPKAWRVELVDGRDSADPNVVLASRPLTKRDAELALLARRDSRFSAAFPAEGVVFVVGGDRFVAPPSPAGALGDPRKLPRPSGYTGDIVARTGRVELSILHLAAYIGPDAPREDAAALDGVAKSVHQGAATAVDRDRGPLRVSGSGLLGGNGIDPENPIFTEPWTAQLRLRLDDDEIIAVRTKGDCFAVTMENVVETRNLNVLHRYCGRMPGAAMLEAANGTVDPGTQAVGEPGEWHLVVVRLGDRVASVQVQLAGRGTVRKEHGHGWFMALSRGRIFRLTGLNDQGARVAHLSDL